MPASKSLEELRKEKEALTKLHKEQLEREKLLSEIAMLREKTRKKSWIAKVWDRFVKEENMGI